MMKNENSVFARNYLSGRYEQINKKKMDLQSKCSKNKDDVVELSKKIEQIKENIDEAYEIFSPIPKTNGFTKTEMAILAQKQVELLEQNKEYELEVTGLESELEVLEKCISFFESEDTEDCSLESLNEMFMKQLAQIQTSVKRIVPERRKHTQIDSIIEKAKKETLCYISNMLHKKDE